MDPDQIKLIRSLGGNRIHILTKVLLPGSIPLILANMKVNIGLCLVGVIIGEFLAAKQGLGYLIIYGSQVFQMDMVVMSIILLCIMSAAWLESSVNVFSCGGKSKCAAAHWKNPAAPAVPAGGRAPAGYGRDRD